jgi:hypothetical protein
MALSRPVVELLGTIPANGFMDEIEVIISPHGYWSDSEIPVTWLAIISQDRITSKIPCSKTVG